MDQGAPARPGRGRALQLVLATIWLFDGVLQLQPVMFTSQFGRTMLAPEARGNPGAVAHSITWASGIIAHHSVSTNAAFAAVQLLLGLGMAWRPTVKAALGLSIAWALGVWWFGEGLGGVFAGTASTVTGAPGAVLIYAVLAVVLWPRRGLGFDASSVAAHAVGRVTAGVMWMVTWGTLSLLSILGPNRSSGGVSDTVRALAAGEPGWLASLDRHVANVLSHRGVVVSAALATVLVAVALGPALPLKVARWTKVLAIVVCIVIWIFGENLGGVFSGSATDPDTGPLLVLLVLAYWEGVPRPSPDPLAQASRPLALEVG